jgi:hypothetical protein
MRVPLRAGGVLRISAKNAVPSVLGMGRSQIIAMIGSPLFSISMVPSALSAGSVPYPTFLARHESSAA